MTRNTTYIMGLLALIALVVWAYWSIGEPFGAHGVAEPTVAEESPTADSSALQPENREIGEPAQENTQQSVDNRQVNDRQIVAGAEFEVPEELFNWSAQLYQGKDARIPAERFGFFRSDPEILKRVVEYSPAFQAALLGRTAPPVFDEIYSSLSIKLFENKMIDLVIKDVQIVKLNGRTHIALSGAVLAPGGGVFSLYTDTTFKSIRGAIDTPDHFIRLDVPFGMDITAVAEYDRSKITTSGITFD